MNRYYKLMMILILFSTANAQLINENFDYNSGNLTSVSSGTWIPFSRPGENPIQVVEGNLNYPGYPSSNTGRMVKLFATLTPAEDDYISFTAQTSGSIYISFLLNVVNDSLLNPNSSELGEFFTSLYSQNLHPVNQHWALVCIRKGTATNTFQLGIQANMQTPTVSWYSTNLNIGETYLIVVRYTIYEGNSNDKADLWINPDILPQIPEPTVSQTANTGTDIDALSKFTLIQNRTYISGQYLYSTPNAYIDGIRIATSWDDSPLPIQLSTFSAYYLNNNSVIIEWETISEINNYGFYIEKFDHYRNIFITIEESFQAGAGTTLLPQKYSWIDENVTENNPQYRLKQIDNDGLINYFGPIMLNPTGIKDGSVPISFNLYQNYPNPFNPKTKINFSVANSGKTILKIYNLLGIEVATLFENFAERGKLYEVEFDATDIPSGVYIYKLQSSNDITFRKMSVIK